MDKQTFLDRIIEVCKNNPIDISKLPSYVDTDTEGWFYLEGDAGRGYSINYVNRMTYDGYAYMASFIIEDTSSDFCLPNPPSESLCFIFQEINTVDGSSTTVSEIPDEFAESALIDLENTLFPKGINYTQIALGITLAAVAAYGLHKMDVI